MPCLPVLMPSSADAATGARLDPLAVELHELRVIVEAKNCIIRDLSQRLSWAQDVHADADASASSPAAASASLDHRWTDLVLGLSQSQTDLPWDSAELQGELRSAIQQQREYEGAIASLRVARDTERDAPLPMGTTPATGAEHASLHQECAMLQREMREERVRLRQELGSNSTLASASSPQRSQRLGISQDLEEPSVDMTLSQTTTSRCLEPAQSSRSGYGAKRRVTGSPTGEDAALLHEEFRAASKDLDRLQARLAEVNDPDWKEVGKQRNAALDNCDQQPPSNDGESQQVQQEVHTPRARRPWRRSPAYSAGSGSSRKGSSSEIREEYAESQGLCTSLREAASAERARFREEHRAAVALTEAHRALQATLEADNSDAWRELRNIRMSELVLYHEYTNTREEMEFAKRVGEEFKEKALHTVEAEVSLEADRMSLQQELRDSTACQAILHGECREAREEAAASLQSLAELEREVQELRSSAQTARGSEAIALAMAPCIAAAVTPHAHDCNVSPRLDGPAAGELNAGAHWVRFAVALSTVRHFGRTRHGSAVEKSLEMQTVLYENAARDWEEEAMCTAHEHEALREECGTLELAASDRAVVQQRCVQLVDEWQSAALSAAYAKQEAWQEHERDVENAIHAREAACQEHAALSDELLSQRSGAQEEFQELQRVFAEESAELRQALAEEAMMSEAARRSAEELAALHEAWAARLRESTGWCESQQDELKMLGAVERACRQSEQEFAAELCAARDEIAAQTEVGRREEALAARVGESATEIEDERAGRRAEALEVSTLMAEVEYWKQRHAEDTARREIELHEARRDAARHSAEVQQGTADIARVRNGLGVANESTPFMSPDSSPVSTRTATPRPTGDMEETLPEPTWLGEGLAELRALLGEARSSRAASAQGMGRTGTYSHAPDTSATNSRAPSSGPQPRGNRRSRTLSPRESAPTSRRDTSQEPRFETELRRLREELVRERATRATECKELRDELCETRKSQDEFASEYVQQRAKVAAASEETGILELSVAVGNAVAEVEEGRRGTVIHRMHETEAALSSEYAQGVAEAALLREEYLNCYTEQLAQKAECNDLHHELRRALRTRSELEDRSEDLRTAENAYYEEAARHAAVAKAHREEEFSIWQDLQASIARETVLRQECSGPSGGRATKAELLEELQDSVSGQAVCAQECADTHRELQLARCAEAALDTRCEELQEKLHSTHIAAQKACRAATSEALARQDDDVESRQVQLQELQASIARERQEYSGLCEDRITKTELLEQLQDSISDQAVCARECAETQRELHLAHCAEAALDTRCKDLQEKLHSAHDAAQRAWRAATTEALVREDEDAESRQVEIHFQALLEAEASAAVQIASQKLLQDSMVRATAASLAAARTHHQATGGHVVEALDDARPGQKHASEPRPMRADASASSGGGEPGAATAFRASAMERASPRRQKRPSKSPPAPRMAAPLAPSAAAAAPPARAEVQALPTPTPPVAASSDHADIADGSGDVPVRAAIAGVEGPMLFSHTIALAAANVPRPYLGHCSAEEADDRHGGHRVLSARLEDPTSSVPVPRPTSSFPVPLTATLPLVSGDGAASAPVPITRSSSDLDATRTDVAMRVLLLRQSRAAEPSAMASADNSAGVLADVRGVPPAVPLPPTTTVCHSPRIVGSQLHVGNSPVPRPVEAQPVSVATSTTVLPWWQCATGAATKPQQALAGCRSLPARLFGAPACTAVPDLGASTRSTLSMQASAPALFSRGLGPSTSPPSSAGGPWSSWSSWQPGTPPRVRFQRSLRPRAGQLVQGRSAGVLAIQTGGHRGLSLMEVPASTSATGSDTPRITEPVTLAEDRPLTPPLLRSSALGCTGGYTP